MGHLLFKYQLRERDKEDEGGLRDKIKSLQSVT